MLCGYKNNVPAAINGRFHMILSVVNLGHGIEEMLPEMEEHIYTFKRKVNLLERLVICNSKSHCPV